MEQQSPFELISRNRAVEDLQTLIKETEDSRTHALNRKNYETAKFHDAQLEALKSALRAVSNQPTLTGMLPQPTPKVDGDAVLAIIGEVYKETVREFEGIPLYDMREIGPQTTMTVLDRVSKRVSANVKNWPEYLG